MTKQLYKFRKQKVISELSVPTTKRCHRNWDGDHGNQLKPIRAFFLKRYTLGWLLQWLAHGMDDYNRELNWHIALLQKTQCFSNAYLDFKMAKRDRAMGSLLIFPPRDIKIEKRTGEMKNYSRRSCNHKHNFKMSSMRSFYNHQFTIVVLMNSFCQLVIILPAGNNNFSIKLKAHFITNIFSRQNLIHKKLYRGALTCAILVECHLLMIFITNKSS